MLSLKRGRKGIPLTEDQKEKLIRIINDNALTIGELAKESGLTYFQIYNPLLGRGRCSRNSYKKILNIIGKYSNSKADKELSVQVGECN